jgi:hypothetical protein
VVGSGTASHATCAPMTEQPWAVVTHHISMQSKPDAYPPDVRLPYKPSMGKGDLNTMYAISSLWHNLASLTYYDPSYNLASSLSTYFFKAATMEFVSLMSLTNLFPCTFYVLPVLEAACVCGGCVILVMKS